MRIKKILVPVDFSSASLESLRYAVPLAEDCGSSVVIVHVLESASFARDLRNMPMSLPNETLPINAKHRLISTAFGGIEPRAPMFMQVRAGKACQEIVSAAVELEVDLIVIASHGCTSAGPDCLSETTKRVVAATPCPALVIRPAADNAKRSGHTEFPSAVRKPPTDSPRAFALKKILVPVDFSDRAKETFHYATALAAPFGAAVSLLNVIPAIRAFGDEAPAQEEIAERLREWSRDVMPTRSQSSAVVRKGAVAAETIATAGSIGADLIIVATHSRTCTSSPALGATTEEIVRRAPCPVLALPDRDRTVH